MCQPAKQANLIYLINDQSRLSCFADYLTNHALLVSCVQLTPTVFLCSSAQSQEPVENTLRWYNQTYRVRKEDRGQQRLFQDINNNYCTVDIVHQRFSQLYTSSIHSIAQKIQDIQILNKGPSRTV